MTGKTIMIVDDDRGFAQSLANMLGASGYRTCVSYDPASALVQARSQPVDCALIDYNLGATLGTTLISRLGEEGMASPDHDHRLRRCAHRHAGHEAGCFGFRGKAL